MGIKIGWAYVNVEGTAAYPNPERVHLQKDPSTTKRGHLSCPAVRATANGFYEIRSPFSLHLRVKKSVDLISFIPIYPFTTVNEPKLREMFRLEPKELWRSSEIPIIQIPSPYFFVADEIVEIEQFPPVFADTTTMNWRPISGRFNIYGWQRPLNWAFEWDTKCGDLIVKMGEPLYYVRFYDLDGRLITNPDLVKISLTEELRARLNSSAGVTALQRGTATLIRKASEERTIAFLDEKK
jgi:hypothetical protein